MADPAPCGQYAAKNDDLLALQKSKNLDFMSANYPNVPYLTQNAWLSVQAKHDRFVFVTDLNSVYHLDHLPPMVTSVKKFLDMLCAHDKRAPQSWSSLPETPRQDISFSLSRYMEAQKAMFRRV
jgi:hypothetical protein